MRRSSLTVLSFALTLLLPGAAFAHSTVTPSQSITSKYETFSLNVPTEKTIPTTAVRLLIPEGLDRVTPIVKPGWTIRVTTNASGTVSRIDWTGGSIPAGQKDMFLFSARTPATSTSLVWKAYQTYRDGTVVAWDRDPSKPDEGQDSVENPYSQTEIASETPAKTGNWDWVTPIMSFAALLISIAALSIALRKKSV
jgi:uncharacterized protein YcnI